MKKLNKQQSPELVGFEQVEKIIDDPNSRFIVLEDPFASWLVFKNRSVNENQITYLSLENSSNFNTTMTYFKKDCFKHDVDVFVFDNYKEMAAWLLEQNV